MPLCISALLLQKEASDIIEIRCKDLKFVSVIYIAINAISWYFSLHISQQNESFELEHAKYVNWKHQ